MDQKGFALIFFIFIILILSLGIIGGSYYLSKVNNKPKASPSITSQIPQTIPLSSSQASSNPIPDSQYCSNKVGFCVDVPSTCQEGDIQLGQDASIVGVEFKCPVTGQKSPSIFHISSSPWNNEFDLNTPQYCSADACDATDSGIFKSSRKIETINGTTYYFHITPIPTNYSYIYFVNKKTLYDLRYGSNDDPTALNKFLKTFKSI